jgi:hypothetical protein
MVFASGAGAIIDIAALQYSGGRERSDSGFR